MAEIDITNDLTQINQQIEDLVNRLTTLNTQRDKLIEQIPLARLGQPEDVARCVSFLVSENASYITGQVINVNGGMLM